ncbi:hypothetical protein TraAM80_08134 [Trypanosoma rangeli]|uniref:Cytochrome b5 heme-binding domain-containing protein n=1 Tax=Trypanosoma rangeli TaxID=5698 RepID=A0A3R7RC54_TRYRA|nr:uncharacterized protein TraAM80_08134 [Trypanosoma rangeli]RNE99541.1 hypothetical protein TraAM80_08134 [Trypanosoma rangeli]|eukprot:RNE99541.1 hypothetical protein TraAM80_08134 [Trypanosoma rangeli]
MHQLRSGETAKVVCLIIVAAASGILLRNLFLCYKNRQCGKEDRPEGNCIFGRKKKVLIRPVSAIECRGFTKEELQEYDGIRKSDIYVSVKGVVYEVAPQLYGPGKSYHVYAGREISRCLAKSDVSSKEANKDWEHGFSKEEMAVLDWWANKFNSKYPVVGWFVPDKDFYTETHDTIPQSL